MSTENTKMPDGVVGGARTWATPTTAANLEAELAAAVALRDSPRIKTEGERELAGRQVRILEILVHGEAKTPMPARHHD